MQPNESTTVARVGGGNGRKDRDVSSTIEQTTLTAPDISCGHCVATVTEALTALDGVQRVEASADTQQVAVSFDSGRVSLPQIEAALGKAGYPVQK